MTRRAGPELHQRWKRHRALQRGADWWLLHWRDGLSYRQISDQVGVPTTTVWRAVNLVHDYTAPAMWGNPRPRRLPPMRGTARQPRGRPYVPGHDGPVEQPRPRRLVPALRCSAHRRDGQPCRRWARRGARVCNAHGGAAPQVVAAARARVEVLEAEHGERDRLGLPDDRAAHHEALKIGAATGRLFSTAEYRRAERRRGRSS